MTIFVICVGSSLLSKTTDVTNTFHAFFNEKWWSVLEIIRNDIVHK